MNRVDRSEAFDRSGRKLVSDPPVRRLVEQRLAQPPVDPPELHDGHDDRDLIALAGRVNAGVAVQLLLDRASGETFVTTIVAGECLTVTVEGALAWESYSHPGAYGLLPQLAR